MCEICMLLEENTSHVHTLAFTDPARHDQGAAYYHRRYARERFWDRIRAEVKMAVREALQETQTTEEA